MSAVFKIDGLAELKAALRNLPHELASEGGHIVEGLGNAALVDIRAGYSVDEGTLRDRTSLEFEAMAFGAMAVINNRDPIAWIYENGAEARHTTGAKTMPPGIPRGSMPPKHNFVPKMMRARRQMWAQLKSLMERHGLLVTEHG